MIDLQTALLFLPAALALNLTPGADMMLCLGMGLRGGPAAGVAAALGVFAAGVIHTLAAALGLAAFIKAWPLAFEAIRWGGAAYLLIMAVGAWREADTPLNAVGSSREQGLWVAFRKGMVVNLLNPKVIVFILALLPQFIDPARPAFGQFMALGLIFGVGGALANLAVGGCAGQFAGRLTRSPRIGRMLRKASAVIFAGLAARLAFSRA